MGRRGGGSAHVERHQVIVNAMGRREKYRFISCVILDNDRLSTFFLDAIVARRDHHGICGEGGAWRGEREGGRVAHRRENSGNSAKRGANENTDSGVKAHK